MKEKHPAAVQLGKLRKSKLTKDQREAEARAAAQARWSKKKPK